MKHPTSPQGGSPERRGGLGRWARNSALAVGAIIEATQGGPKNITSADVQGYQDKHPGISQPVPPNQAIGQANENKGVGVGNNFSHQVIDSGHLGQTIYSGDGNLTNFTPSIHSSANDNPRVARSALKGSHGPNTAAIQHDRQIARGDFGQVEVIGRGGTRNEILDTLWEGLVTTGKVLENIPLPVAAACSAPVRVASSLPTPTKEISPAVKTPTVEPVYGQISEYNKKAADNLVASLRGPIMTDISTVSPFEVTVHTMKINAEKILRSKGLDPERYQLIIPISDFVLSNVNNKTYVPPYLLVEKETGFNYVIYINKNDARLLSLPNNAGIVYAGDIPVVGVKGIGISDLTGKTQGDRAFMFPAMAMIDYSNVDSGSFGSDQLNQILSQQNQIKQFVWDTLGQYPNAEFNFLVSVNNNGSVSLLAEVFINGIKQIAVQNPSGGFVFIDSNYFMTPGRRPQLDAQGNLHSVIAGRGANEGQEFDEGIFNPLTGRFEYSDIDALFTPTPTPTATVTPQPTETRTPTATATTATLTSEFSKPPKFEWSVSFDNGVNEFTYDGKDRLGPTSTYDIIDDPTGSGKGKVYRGVVTGPPPVLPGTDNGKRHRPYPTIFFPYQEGPYATEGFIWVSKPVPRLIISPPKETDPWFSPIGGIFDRGGPTDRHWVLTTHLGFQDGQYRLVLLANDDPSWRGTLSPIAFPFETWVKLRIEVGSDRVARLYQDGSLVSTKRLPPSSLLGTIGGHWGLYAGRDVENLVVLNDNIKFQVYPK